MNKAYYEAVMEIIKTGHWITHRVSQELREFDIYEPQFNVLRILRGAKGKPLSVNTILERMLQKSSNVTRIVDKLEGRGLVERTLCSTDRRKMDIVITDAGLELLEKLDIKVAALHDPMAENLTEAELETLAALIKKLKSNIKS
ncbi:MarR family winged helix-turn-helix transcriptional regulator [Sediminicola luteus]|uniref:HTH marR-type domain-containing protein n=1 Tax=Sediminicola luteus TaxID=319238 RepID=A0A2A4G7G0_9FLAO|nr:MarR family transcriptional regulator [Sediminicola luteus]PCE63918.1 hypothetical protein B7P33_11705 [Sediminicola luteus]